MEDNNYAPILQTLDQENTTGSSKRIKPSKLNIGIPDNPYGVKEHYYAKLIMKEYQACPSKVALEYFSVTNIKRLQKKIKREIKHRSYGKFILEEDQNVLDLLTSMRAIFKLYARNLPIKIVRQVKALNEYTIQYICPDMMTNLKQYYGYLDDIKNPINPFDRVAVNVNQAGRNQLPSVAQLYGL
jgi:hypothetical protein